MVYKYVFFLLQHRPPIYTRTDPPFPYTTPFRSIGAAQYDGCQRTSTITKAHPPLGKTALPAEPVPSCQSDPCHPARFLPDGCRQRGGKIFARAYQIAGVIAHPDENAPAAVCSYAQPQFRITG